MTKKSKVKALKSVPASRPSKSLGARVSSDRATLISLGELEARNLAECLAVDFALLYGALFSKASAAAIEEARRSKELGILKRMQTMAELIQREHGYSPALKTLETHVSDTARGWASFLIGRNPKFSLEEKLERLRPFADDPHFGVREWAWMSVRNEVAADVPRAIQALRPWTGDPSFRIRRFATEATRPRGVWAEHIGLLKEKPELGLPLLEPLSADPERYVQDSVANWLNDAAKSRPEWVRNLCAKWRKNALPATLYIAKRATRSFK